MKTLKIEKSCLTPEIYSLLKSYHENHKSWIISGGFARFIGHKLLGVEWGSKTDLYDYFTKNLGDVDFFTDHYEKDLNKIKLETKQVNKSLEFYLRSTNKIKQDDTINSKIYIEENHFADNLFSTLRQNINSFFLDKRSFFKVKNQFVKKFTYNSINEMSEAFDLINSKWFIDLTGKDLILVYDEKALQLDGEKLLGINEAEKNPLFSSRVVKYIKTRGLNNGIHCDSLPLFKSYLYNAASDNWDKKYIDILSENFSRHHLDKNKFLLSISKKVIYEVSNSNLLSINDYSMFIGKWNIDVPVYEEYSSGSYNTEFSLADNNSGNRNIYKRIIKIKKDDFASHHIKNYKDLHENNKS